MTALDSTDLDPGPVDPVETLAQDLCDTYYLTVDPDRPMSNAYNKITERTREHWRHQAEHMLQRGWTNDPDRDRRRPARTNPNPGRHRRW